MIEKKINNSHFLVFENLSKFDNLVNFVSTRASGDMAYNETKPTEYLVNREKFLNIFGIGLDDTVFCEQVHKDRVEVVNNSFFKDRVDGINVVSQADGLVTSMPGICLVIRTSDCVPIIMFDPYKNILGVAHAGWRGTYVEIAKRTVYVMSQQFNSRAEDLVIGIGPSIGPKDFFVRNDVQEQFEKAGWSDFLDYNSPDQWLVDLPGINKKQLVDSGVKEKNIEISGISTYSSDKLFSYRKKDPEGHFITGALIK